MYLSRTLVSIAIFIFFVSISKAVEHKEILYTMAVMMIVIADGIDSIIRAIKRRGTE